MTVYVPLFGMTCYAVLKPYTHYQGWVAGFSLRLPRSANGKTIRMRRSNINALARKQVYSTPLKEELIAKARFCFDLFARLARAFGGRFQLATGRHNVVTASLADRARVASLIDDICKSSDPVVR